MSHNNNERRELTAAELDLVAGGNTFQDCMISNYFIANSRGDHLGNYRE